MTESQQILVVDDDSEIVRVLRAYLEQAGFPVATAYDGETALQALRRDQPALVILDLMLPNRDGWSITRIVREDKSLSSIPIIMLTARVEAAERVLGLELGADDYVTKPFDPREVLARVRSVLRRTQPARSARPRALQVGNLVMDPGRREVQLDGRDVELTATEFKLLQAMMEAPGQVFTRLELIDKALGSTYAGLDRTLDRHMNNLRRKIEPEPGSPIYIDAVRGVGYRVIEPKSKDVRSE
jgi:two-component system, OmpR family, alkaline phosphatase synthesis response regulator PhoP